MSVEYPSWKGKFNQKKAKVKLRILEDLMDEFDEDVVYSAMIEIVSKDAKNWVQDSYRRRNVEDKDDSTE